MSITSFKRMLNLYQVSIDYKIFNNTRYIEIPVYLNSEYSTNET